MKTILMMKRSVAAFAASAAVMTPAVNAATAVTTMQVTASALSTCLVVATPVVFGNYTLGQVDSTGLITVTCTPDVLTYNVALDAGAGVTSTTSTRKMTSQVVGADTLGYALYRDSARTLNWGNVVASDVMPSSGATTTAGVVKTFTVFGRLSANQTGSLGAYLDTVNVTVNY